MQGLGIRYCRFRVRGWYGRAESQTQGTCLTALSPSTLSASRIKQDPPNWFKGAFSEPSYSGTRTNQKPLHL